MELVVARGFPLHWRTGNRRIIGPRPDVHRGNLACCMAWTSRRILSIQYRARNPARLSFQLSDRSRELWLDGMALGVGRFRHPCIPLFRDVVWHSSESEVAG